MNQAAIDQPWYEKLTAIKGVRPVHAYLPTLHGEEVTGYSPRMLHLAQEQLRALRTELTASDTDKPLKAAYLAVVEEQMQKGYLLQAAWDKDLAAFKKANHDIYGPLDPELWAASGAYLRDRLNKRLGQRGLHALVQWPKAVEESAVTLYDYMPEPRRLSVLRESFDALPWVRQMHERAPTQAMITLEELVALCRTVITDVLGMHDSRVLLEEAPVFRMRVVQERKELIIYGRRNMKVNTRRAVALALHHEIGTHMVRRLHAQQSSFALMRSGLDKYELGEEGLGVLGELLAYPSLGAAMKTRRMMVLAVRYYIAGLLSGIDPTYPNSQVVMGHCRDFYAAWQQTVGRRKDDQERLALAARQADIMAMSLLKGIGHNADGAYFGRQACYLPGVIALCKLLTGTSGIDMAPLYAGHFNPTREDHRRFVALYGHYLLPS